jgi:hypothetical protein
MRRTPYTTRGIRRIPCFRCGQPSAFQWNVCADGGRYRGVCDPCDIALNELVLRFFGDKEWRTKMAKYKAR